MRGAIGVFLIFLGIYALYRELNRHEEEKRTIYNEMQIWKGALLLIMLGLILVFT